MQRVIESKLVAWKDRAHRLPLIIQGARQVGKTYMMKWLGQSHFQRYAYFNFDERPELREFFANNKDTERILNSLALISGIPMDRHTLVILDEIQECPEALNTLKYFAESCPHIPVICAGSLLGVLLHPGHSFPVGKVEFLQMHPMTFREVLPHWDARGATFLEGMTEVGEIPAFFFNDLVDHFKKYMVTGGLPAVVREFNATNSFDRCEAVLENLLLSYKGDFAKHPVMNDVARIVHVFDSLPAQLARENRKFVYRLVREGARAKEYEDAIQWLVRTGLVHQVRLCSRPAMPLSAYDDSSAFKLYGLDVGLVRRMSRLSPLAYSEGNRLFTEFKGALTENFILQSLVAQFDDVPRYWTSGNTAEVDFIVQYGNSILPIEVKSDENVKSRSLTLYSQKFGPELRIRYSLRNLHYADGLLNIPHFLADHTSKLIGMVGMG